MISFGFYFTQKANVFKTNSQFKRLKMSYFWPGNGEVRYIFS